MKTKLLTIVLFTMMAGNVSAQQSSLVVVIKNVKEATGRIAVALFDNEKDFTKKRLQGKTTLSKLDEVEVTFDNIVPGNYAISVMHDANANDE
ncbi:MAG: DUF2141 domain-containing protein, partial [Bacteroidia bacterium]|nr:DUF2141 domain-containing protein [Bacteroidia bacterium]